MVRGVVADNSVSSTDVGGMVVDDELVLGHFGFFESISNRFLLVLLEKLLTEEESLTCWLSRLTVPYLLLHDWLFIFSNKSCSSSSDTLGFRVIRTFEPLFGGCFRVTVVFGMG